MIKKCNFLLNGKDWHTNSLIIAEIDNRTKNDVFNKDYFMKNWLTVTGFDRDENPFSKH